MESVEQPSSWRMFRLIVCVIPILVFVVGVCLLFDKPAYGPEQSSMVKVSLEGHGFDGAAAAYAERAKQVFDLGSRKCLELNKAGWMYNRLSVAAAWVAFLCTTAITAIAAYFSPGADPEQTKSAEALKSLQKRLKRHAWVIGALAALAAVCAPVSERAGAASQSSFSCSIEVLQLVRDTRILLVDRNPPLEQAEAEGLLDEVENKVNQACYSRIR